MLQDGVLNAAELARSLAVDGKTITKHLDLMVDLLLVRRSIATSQNGWSNRQGLFER